MIKNAREYRITNAQAEKFRRAIADAEASPPPAGIHPKLAKASIDGMRAQLQALEAELRAYQGLRTAKGKKRLSGRIEDLGTLLTQARIARGWTQRELGERLGMKMQQVQHYEATGYASASADRIREVLQALGARVNVDVELVPLPGKDELIRDLRAAGPRVARTR